MTHAYDTTLVLAVAGGEEREQSIRVEYSREPGSVRTSCDPGGDPSVTVDRILVVTHRGPVPAAWLEDLLRDDPELLSDLMQHWTDEDDAARDRRDEDRMQDMRDRMREGSD
jgi:hypothetical protein